MTEKRNPILLDIPLELLAITRADFDVLHA